VRTNEHVPRHVYLLSRRRGARLPHAASVSFLCAILREE